MQLYFTLALNSPTQRSETREFVGETRETLRTWMRQLNIQLEEKVFDGCFVPEIVSRERGTLKTEEMKRLQRKLSG